MMNLQNIENNYISFANVKLIPSQKGCIESVKYTLSKPEDKGLTRNFSCDIDNFELLVEALNKLLITVLNSK